LLQPISAHYNRDVDARDRVTEMGKSQSAASRNGLVIGTASRTAGRKLVKNLKYIKMGLAAGALDQFVEIFGAPSQSVLGTVEDSRSNSGVI